MPLTRISLRAGRSDKFKVELMDLVHQAMVETFDAPADGRFTVISEHSPAEFDFGPEFLGMRKTDDLLMIQIFANNTRSLAQKKNVYAEICRKLHTQLEVRPEDVLISLVEVKPEDWSFGNGLAQDS